MTKGFFDFPETYYTSCIYLLEKLKTNVQANLLMGLIFRTGWRVAPTKKKILYGDLDFWNFVYQSIWIIVGESMAKFWGLRGIRDYWYTNANWHQCFWYTIVNLHSWFLVYKCQLAFLVYGIRNWLILHVLCPSHPRLVLHVLCLSLLNFAWCLKEFLIPAG